MAQDLGFKEILELAKLKRANPEEYKELLKLIEEVTEDYIKFTIKLLKKFKEGMENGD